MSSESVPQNPKRGFGRGVVVALVVVILVLAGGMGYLLYKDNNTINSKDQTITLLKSELASKDNMTSSLNSTISSLETQKATISSELSSANQSKITLEDQIDSLSGSLSSDNSTIANLQVQLNHDNSTIASLNTQMGVLNSQIADLTNQVNNLDSIVNLNNVTTEVYDYTVSQPAGSYSAFALNIPYAGYIEIQVQSSTSSSTYAALDWSGYGITYFNSITTGQSGTAYFPVLPGSSVTAEVGNSNLINGATETVTINYFY
jgi:Tfp pilus assembly protein PilO